MCTTARSSAVSFDPALVPFSRYGSYLALSLLPEADDRAAGLYLRSVRGPALGDQALFHVELTRNGQPCPFTCRAEPALLTLTAEDGFAEICLPSERSVRIRCRGVGLRLSMTPGGYNNLIETADGWLTTVCSSMELKLLIRSLTGKLDVDAPWQTTRSERMCLDLRPIDGLAECEIQEFRVVPPAQAVEGSFDECHERVADEFERWLNSQPETPVRYHASAALAAYINWSCVVAPSGNLPRPAIYMSKNRMANIWSWDNCFNALALAERQPDLAWDQFMIMFDLQDESGVLPDLANDLFSSWSFCKPPVHGWTLRRLLNTAPVLASRVDEIYGPLSRWTEWWCDHRAIDGLPHYYHGNDSGWDNSTVFDVRPPLESPDLSAYLVLQMEMLADLARIMGRQQDAAAWTSRAEQLLALMLDTFWRGDHFVARQANGRADIATDSLFLLLPILLGKRLPYPVRAALIAELKDENRFLTAHGLASEAVTSEQYTPDGYWRGPIWGAPTLMIVDGLRAAGEQTFAVELCRRFCDMVAANGLAENYDALTGAGLRDRAFTWTASIFLVLAHELFQAEQKMLV